MDWCGEKALNGAVATRTPARDIAHGDVLRRTQRPGDDGTELTQHGGGMDLTKGAKQCEDIHGFSLFLGVRYQKYTGKAIFMLCDFGVGIGINSELALCCQQDVRTLTGLVGIMVVIGTTLHTKQVRNLQCIYARSNYC